MDRVNRTIELLYDRGEHFFSLDELATQVGISRSELDDAMRLLDERGHRFEHSPAHGVRLVRPVRLDANLIERRLGLPFVGRNVICFGEVDSTNDVAFDSALQDDADGLVVLAESQRLGRGRLGRSWISRPGANILMSTLLGSNPLLPHEALTIAAGVAVAEGIEAATDLAAQLKWPNDVLLDGAKVAGILVETRTIGGSRVAVVGIGINANAAPPDAEVDFPTTCIADQLHHPVERIELVIAVLNKLDEWVEAVQAGALDRLHDAWISRCGMLNERVTVWCNGIEHVGRVLDVSPMGELVLECDTGRRLHLAAEGSTLACNGRAN